MSKRWQTQKIYEMNAGLTASFRWHSMRGDSCVVGLSIDADELVIIWLLALIWHLICVSQTRRWKRTCFLFVPKISIHFHLRKSVMFAVSVAFERNLHENGNGTADTALCKRAYTLSTPRATCNLFTCCGCNFNMFEAHEV